jgi:hypothetical protein
VGVSVIVAVLVGVLATVGVSVAVAYGIVADLAPTGERHGASGAHPRAVQAILSSQPIVLRLGEQRTSPSFAGFAVPNAQRHTAIRSGNAQRVLLTRQGRSPRLDSRGEPAPSEQAGTSRPRRCRSRKTGQCCSVRLGRLMLTRTATADLAGQLSLGAQGYTVVWHWLAVPQSSDN